MVKETLVAKLIRDELKEKYKGYKFEVNKCKDAVIVRILSKDIERSAVQNLIKKYIIEHINPKTHLIEDIYRNDVPQVKQASVYYFVKPEKPKEKPKEEPKEDIQPNGKNCIRCGKPLTGRKVKYCGGFCQLRYKWEHEEPKVRKWSFAQHKRMRRAEKMQRLGKIGMRIN